MARRLSNAELEQLVGALAHLRKDPERADADELLASALASNSPHAQARAAQLVAEQRRPGHEQALLGLYERAFKTPAKSDPGCKLKQAAAEALDFSDHDDPAPFLRGVQHVQLEAGWGKPTDSAGPLRARCALALVRLRYGRVLDHLADHLCDDDPAVRSSACRALAFHGDEKGAPLLRMKLSHSDPEPEVVGDALQAYLALDVEQGLLFAERLLVGGAAAREGALLALGESRQPQAFDLIHGFLERATAERDLHVACVALGTLRSPEAREELLRRVRHGSEVRCTCALHGLTLFTGQPDVAVQAREAEDKNPETALGRLVERLFPELG